MLKLNFPVEFEFFYAITPRHLNKSHRTISVGKTTVAVTMAR